MTLAQLYTLTNHPDMLLTKQLNLGVSVQRDGGTLRLAYHLQGATDTVKFAQPTEPIRTDGLWKTTCFEIFAMANDGPAYTEFNFSPSSQWAAYQFSSYREGMTNTEIRTAPRIEQVEQGNEITYKVVMELPEALRNVDISVGVSAVVEQKDGTKSYWALKHPEGPADFHNPSCFILQLKAPDAA